MWPKAGETSSEVEGRIFTKIGRHIGLYNTYIPIYRKAWFQAAAILLLIASLSTFLVLKNTFSEKKYQSGTVSNIMLAAQDNKYVILADSSKILLHPGSKLSYKFSSGKREVTLNGEAYFDIHRDGKRPFIIRTGHFRTTVLGTAFNIKAYQGKPVTVSVARGKVQVENEKSGGKTILLKGMQLIDGGDSGKHIVIRNADLMDATKWMNLDLKFSDTPFSVLAGHLEHRYGIKIKFVNKNLGDCMINGGFTGMETLEDVLVNLTQTIGAHYKIEDNLVLIDGQGCN